MYKMICICINVLVATGAEQQYHGILINGISGSQLYDPFNSPHALGNLQLGLQTGLNAWFAAAVIDGPLAYFASGFGSVNLFFQFLHLNKFPLQTGYFSSTTSHRTRPRN